MTEFEMLLACYRSGQVSERQWQAHMENKAFRAWVENQNPINCPSACVDGSTRGVIACARAALAKSEAVP